MGNIITLTTDFGPGEYVGAMKGAILSIDAGATIVDIDHQVRAHDVRHGAYVMFGAAPYYPYAAHVGVVDPGVGTARRGIVVACKGGLLVGPDNGLLIPAARRLGLQEVRHLKNPDLGLPNRSDTFHGRDLFAPVAAQLLTGTRVEDVGPTVRDFVDLDFGEPREMENGFEGVVITHDRFGNIVTNIPRSAAERMWTFGTPLSITLLGYEMTVRLVRTYGEVGLGEYLATLSSSGFLEIARRESSASDQIGVMPGAPVSITKA